METQVLIQEIVAIIVTGFLIPLAYEGIRWARRKANQNAFFEKLEIDDVLFEIAEDTVKTVLPDAAKAATTLNNVDRDKALRQLAIRMKAHGVDVYKTHGKAGLQEVLAQALATIKFEAKVS
ncbi:MAG: hypothetical protein ACYSWY_05390 [Planctomycetota bacterium]|jgi:hypothetical protein